MTFLQVEMETVGRFVLLCLVIGNLKLFDSVSAGNDVDTIECAKLRNKILGSSTCSDSLNSGIAYRKGSVSHEGTTNQGIDPSTRVDCWPQPVMNVTELEQACIQRGCIFDAQTHKRMPSAPQCYFPINTGYALLNSSHELNDTLYIYKKGMFQNPYGADIAFLKFSYKKYANTLHIRIGQTGRFEPPIKFHTSIDSPPSLDVHIDNSTDMFAFKVFRSGRSTPIWDTSIGSLLFSDQYIQIATFLPSDRVFGFGEHAHSSLKHDLSRYTTWGMLARDEMPEYGKKSRKNLYGVHPFYLCVESDFSAHGVFFANTAPQEVTLGPGPHLVYRTIGGNLDIYMFEGPTPQMVINQYLQLVGMPLSPPLWSMGFQIGRNGYTSASELDQVVQKTESRGILFNVVNINMDYMQDFNDFTLNKEWNQLTNITQKWHQQGYKFTIVINTAISVKSPSFKDAIVNNVSFIEWPTEDLVPTQPNSLYAETNGTKLMLGVGLPNDHVVYPDFLDDTSGTHEWWSARLRLFHRTVPFDGVWLSGDEPTSFGTNQKNPWYYNNSTHHAKIAPLRCPLTGTYSKYDNPPFKTTNSYYYGSEGELSSKTLCMIGSVRRGKMRFSDTKNLYGLSQASSTYETLMHKPFNKTMLITRSTYPSSGSYAGHWLGATSAGWDDLRGSIVTVQEFNMFGIPYVGAYICGDGSAVDDVELCVRWYQLGAFYSLSSDNNYKSKPSKDPLYNEVISVAARQASLFRYYYLPYIYTLHETAAVTGDPVLKPVFFVAANDEKTYNISHQFMLGDGMMVIPVTEKNAVDVSGYLPNGRWYSLRTEDYGIEIAPGERLFTARLNESIPVLARGGNCIPRQRTASTAPLSLMNPFDLLIALDETGHAEGSFYWEYDTTQSTTSYRRASNFAFNAYPENSTLLITNRIFDPLVPPFDVVEVLGTRFVPDLSSVKIDSRVAKVDLQKSYWDDRRKLVHIEGKGLIDLQTKHSITVEWNHKKSTTSSTSPITPKTTSGTVRSSTFTFRSTTPSTSPTTPKTTSGTVQSSTFSFRSTTPSTSPITPKTTSGTVRSSTFTFRSTTPSTSPTTAKTTSGTVRSSTFSPFVVSFALFHFVQFV